MNSGEELKQIKDFNEYYISNFGKIYKKTKENYREISSFYHEKSKRYISILSQNGKRKGFCLHRLTALYFVKNPNNYSMVCFVNGNRKDIRANNLYWCKQDANIPCWNIGTSQKGETAFFNSKLTEELVVEILNSNDLHDRIAKEFGISRVMVTLIKNRKRWGWLNLQT